MNKVKDDYRQTDKKLDNLETQAKMLKQQAESYLKEINGNKWCS